MAFFPCIRFENQALLMFRGDQTQLKGLSDEQKLEYDLELHDDLHNLYNLITKLVIVCLRKGLKLIIENPYSSQHYLTRYWALKPSIIDYNRRDRGDYFEKPTQYWFVNCEPKNNMILESVEEKEKKIVSIGCNVVERSMISKEYANRFIREFIIDGTPKVEEKEITIFD